MIKDIKDEKDYARAVQRLELMMFNVQPHSPEWDELLQLAKIVEKYENENFIYIDPGKRISQSPLFDLGMKITSSHMKRDLKEK